VDSLPYKADARPRLFNYKSRQKMLKRVADWHGEQAAKFYMQYLRTGVEAELNSFLRHVSIADKLWRVAK
jgi:hypothetical protein